MRQRRLPVEQVDLQKREIDLECENTCLRMERDISQTIGDIQRSIRRVCNCYDNAIQQSFWNILKREPINGRQLRTIIEAPALVLDYFDMFYNRKTRHTSLGYVSPESFEANHNYRTLLVCEVCDHGQQTCSRERLALRSCILISYLLGGLCLSNLKQR